MPCTAAANCGVKSHELFTALRYGLAPNMVDFAQEMSRVDRGHVVVPGEHQYLMFLFSHLVMNGFLRIFQQKTKTIREKQQFDLLTLLTFVLLPQECYHSFLENLFEPCDEDGDEVMSEGCGGMCAYCTNEYFGFTEQSRKMGL